MSAIQPTATTASAASALLPDAVLREVHPHAVRRLLEATRSSPKSSRTTMPDSRKAAATAAETSSSSVGRMRGPAWKSWTREPNALKIEATCTPVAPPPMTSIDGGTAVRLQASLWVAVSSKPGTESRRLAPPVQRMILSAWSRSPLAVSMVCGSTKRARARLARGR